MNSEQRDEQSLNQTQGSLKLAEGSLRGQVSFLNNPVGNAMVTVGTFNAVTDEKGNFSLDHIPPGFATLKVRTPSSRFYNYSEGIIVEAGNPKNVLICLEPNGIVKGTVSDENGKPLSSAEVSGHFKVGEDTMICKTDERGTYAFTDVPRGNYYVKASAQGFTTIGKNIDVANAKTTVCDFVPKAFQWIYHRKS